MAKIVYSKTDDVVAIWAKQSQEFARTGSNTSFRGLKLFSYSTCIARLADTPNRERVALISTGGYSTTTAVVIGQAHTHAHAEGFRLFFAPHLGGETIDHERNLASYSLRITEALEKVERARKPDGHRKAAGDLMEAARNYAATFALPWRWDGEPVDSFRSKSEREAT